MVKLKMSIDNLKQLIDVLNIYDVDAPIVFNKDGAVIKCLDPSRTAMVITAIKKDAFVEYTIDDGVEEIICIPRDKLSTVLKSFKGDVTLETDNGWLVFSSGKTKLKLRNMEYDKAMLQLNLKLEYNISFDMTAEQFKNSFDTTAVFDQYTIIEFNNKVVTFRSASETDGNVSVGFEEDELKNVTGDGSAKVAISSSYLKGVLKLKPNRFIVSIDEAKPIKIIVPLMEGMCRSTIMVAPVILDE